jgi:hypothetical protein
MNGAWFEPASLERGKAIFCVHRCEDDCELQ